MMSLENNLSAPDFFSVISIQLKVPSVGFSLLFDDFAEG